MINYEIKRLYTPNTLLRGKKYLDGSEEKALFNGEVVIEEKLDGKLVRVPLGDYVLVGEDLRQTHTICYKNLPSAYIFFDVYDVKGKCFLGLEDKTKLFYREGLIQAPIIFRGSMGRDITSIKSRLEDIVFNYKSAFETELNPLMKRYLVEHGIYMEWVDKRNFIEGVVIKNYSTQVFAKVVNPVFEQLISRLGRYEKYRYENTVKQYSMEEYYNYQVKHVISHILKLDVLYRNYLSKVYSFK